MVIFRPEVCLEEDEEVVEFRPRYPVGEVLTAGFQQDADEFDPEQVVGRVEKEGWVGVVAVGITARP